MVISTIQTVVAQPDTESGREALRRIAAGFRPRDPRRAALLDEVEATVLTRLPFPHEHWHQIWSNNPLQPLNTEVQRRIGLVGISINQVSVIRLLRMSLAEQHHEWQVIHRSFSAESLPKLQPEEGTEPLALTVSVS